ncbi:tetratricopeptide repeat protein [Aurantibacter sp.]|uniref:tetratricopeptide repeat protein n=1 Tax=Aurantibacter sp. TaxID=2807103 RepID=UPI003265DC3B
MIKTKILYLLLGLLTYFNTSLAQNQKEVDSLLHIYSTNDSIKVKMYALDDLIDIYIYTEPKIAKGYIDQMLQISKDSNYKHGILRAEFCLGHYYSTLGQMELGATYYRKTLKRSKKDNDDSFLATVYKNLSIYESHIGNYHEAIRLMDSSAVLHYEWEDYLRYGSDQNIIGKNYFDMGNYPKAMEMYQAALKTMDTIAIKTYHKADTFVNIGTLHHIQENYGQAMRYFEKAMEVYQQTDDHLYQANTYIDIGNAHEAKKEFALAIQNYHQALELGEKYDFPIIQQRAYGAIGLIHKEKGEYRQTISFLKKALSIEGADVSQINKVSYLSNLGYTYTLTNDFNTAFKHFNTSIRLADSIKVGNELQESLYYRGLLHEKAGNQEEAIKDFKRSRVIKDSLFTIAKTTQINKLQILYDTERKEAAIALQQEEINTLNEKAKNDTLTKGLYAGGMASALALFGLSVFGYRQRIKKNRSEREKQEEIYKQEIAHKKKELTSQTLHLVQKNTFIQELTQHLENVENSPDKFKTEFRRIVMLLKKENASDKDWEVFKTYFSEVHNDFDQKLKTLSADISEKEIRLAAFLRMNLTTKEIAATMNVLPDSILKSKYRLKKKLGIDKEIDLTTFLNNL